jgi:hypothetical protein
MRHGIGLFALVFGCIIIGVAARYGFTTSDNDLDGYIWAAIYGGVTLAGLCGHAIGVRLWRYGLHKLSLSIFAVSLFILLISLSNSLGAMAGRADKTQAERLKVAETVRADRRDLERKQKEQDGLKFKPTDKDAVDAARSTATAATTAKEAECSPHRGPRCREKEAAEATALADLTTATKEKASTDQANKLDGEIKALKEKIEKAAPVLEANSQGNALARLFALPEGDAAKLSTYQNLAMGFGIELLIALAFILYEVMMEHELERMPKPAPAFAPVAPADTPIEIEPDEALAIAPPVIEHDIEEEEPQEEPEPLPRPRPLTFPAHPRPRLIASRPDPVGSVPDIMAEIMEPGRGKVEVVTVFAAYAEACKRSGKRPMAAEEFTEALGGLCKQLGIKIEATAKGVFLLKVRLKRKPQVASGGRYEHEG